VVDGSPANLDVRWATLLHDIGKEKARVRDEAGRDRFIGHDKISGEMSIDIMKRLKFDNASVQKISKLIYLHQAEPEKRHKLKHFLRHLGAENLEDWHAMRQADIKAHKPEKIEHGMQIYSARKEKIDDILAKGEPYAISHLDINGDDLIAAGIPAGPLVGKILRGMLDLVIMNPNKNNKKFLKQWAINNRRRIADEI
jgi:tRNA nucleotidyltransferase (CCA-adding enzyme)